MNPRTHPGLPGQTKARGGNAANTGAVAAQLDMDCAMLSVLGSDSGTTFVEENLAACGVDTSQCPREEGATLPTSYITTSMENGSRTIVHLNELRELQLEEFVGVGTASEGELPWQWIHFEGRNVEETQRMMSALHACPSRAGVRVSVELEKNRDGLVGLLPYADVVLVGREWAEAEGFDDAAKCLLHLAGAGAQSTATLICAWGSSGAYCISDISSQTVHHQPAYVVCGGFARRVCCLLCCTSNTTLDFGRGPYM